MRTEFKLIRNPKVYRNKPFVARIDLEKGDLEFLRATIPVYEKGVLVGGEYELEPGNYYIVRIDESSHRKSRSLYELYYVGRNGIEKIAWIMFEGKTPLFSDDEIKEIYAMAKGNGRRVINTLIEYARKHSMKHKISVEDIIRSEVQQFISTLEKKYGVKIKISITVEK